MNKNVKIIGIIAVVIIVVGLIFLVLKQKQTNQVGQTTGQTGVTKEMLTTQTPEAATETNKLINETITNTGTSSVGTISVSSPNGTEGSSTVTQIKVVTVTPGSSPIDVNSGKVVTPTGVVANNSAEAASPAAPSQSYPISESSAPASAIKLKVTSSSFTPNTFTVNRGQAVSLVVTNTNESTFSEVFRFDDASLSGVVLGLAKGETKSITFNAPAKAGEYAFYSSMFDHRAQGAVGKMIVK